MALDIVLTDLRQRLVDATPQYDASIGWDEDRAGVELRWQAIVEREWRDKELSVYVAHPKTGEPTLVSPTPVRKIFWYEGPRLDRCSVGTPRQGAMFSDPFVSADEFGRLKTKYLDTPVSAVSAVDEPTPNINTSRRKGPIRGVVRRYDEAYAALIPEMRQLMREHKLSRTAAALKLAEADRVPGTGTPQSRAKALMNYYREQQQLTDTR